MNTQDRRVLSASIVESHFHQDSHKHHEHSCLCYSSNQNRQTTNNCIQGHKVHYNSVLSDSWNSSNYQNYCSKLAMIACFVELLHSCLNHALLKQLRNAALWHKMPLLMDSWFRTNQHCLVQRLHLQ